MRIQPVLMVIIIILFFSLIDIYAFSGVSQLVQGLRHSWRLVVSCSYWTVTGLIVLWLVWLMSSFKSMAYEQFYHNATVFFGIVILVYVPKIFFNIFLLVHDITGILKMLQGSISGNPEAVKMTRMVFILQLGLIISGFFFISIFWGIWKGKYNFTVKKHTLHFAGLPEAFNGVRIIQISDFHIGSFHRNPEQVKKAVELINNEDADYVFFTGDMVNNKSVEMEPFIPVLSGIRARKGKFSILGNHDYGDYYHWNSEAEKLANMEELYLYHEQSGFRLLRNESVQLSENGESIALIGMENWGLPPFPQYGDLEKAMEKVQDIPFKILLSHDPSHWDAEVVGKTDISLTLSGHTHGMQFAIRVPGWSWSPVKMKYPRWNGLYREGVQYLYVSIGIGFIGFPGRVGTPPEITVFELTR